MTHDHCGGSTQGSLPMIVPTWVSPGLGCSVGKRCEVRGSFKGYREAVNYQPTWKHFNINNQSDFPDFYLLNIRPVIITDNYTVL